MGFVFTTPVRTMTRDTTPSAVGFRLRAARRGDAEAMSQLFREVGYPQAADSSTVNWVVSHPEVEVLVAADAADRAIGILTLSHRPQLRHRQQWPPQHLRRRLRLPRREDSQTFQSTRSRPKLSFKFPFSKFRT